MGPPSSNVLHSLWTKNEAQISFGPDHRERVDSLVRCLSRMKREDIHEGVLSSHVAKYLSDIVAQIYLSLRMLHRMYSLDKSAAHIDITVLDSQSEAFNMYSIREIRWEYDVNEFPEIEATALARLLEEEKSPCRIVDSSLCPF